MITGGITSVIFAVTTTFSAGILNTYFPSVNVITSSFTLTSTSYPFSTVTFNVIISSTVNFVVPDMISALFSPYVAVTITLSNVGNVITYSIALNDTFTSEFSSMLNL